MAATNVTISIDEGLKKQAESLFDEIGLNMTTALTIFIKAAVRQQKIPFELAADTFCSEANQERLCRAAKDMDAGKWNVHELLEADDD